MSAMPSGKTRLVVVLARAQAGVQLGFVTGAHIALYKPISVERVGLGLRAVRNLMARERRRSSERIAVAIPATLGRAGSGTPVVIVDLSDGGAAIRCELPLPSSGLLTLHCLLPDTTGPFMATAEVLWQDAQGQSGIRFVNLASSSRQILVEWLNATASDADKSWTATSEQPDTANPNPTRTTETHTVTNGRTVDRQTFERVGTDGRYQPYLDFEKESIRVEATTERIVKRSFGRDPDGQKHLTQMIEEEIRTLPGGDQKLVRTSSNPDVNGRLQIVRREIQDAKQISSSVRETKTTT